MHVETVPVATETGEPSHTATVLVHEGSLEEALHHLTLTLTLSVSVIEAIERRREGALRLEREHADAMMEVLYP